MLLINTQKALDSMLSTKVKLGADASVAVGPKGAGQGATLTADIVAYSKAKGAYASMALDGQVPAWCSGKRGSRPPFGAQVTPSNRRHDGDERPPPAE